MTDVSLWDKQGNNTPYEDALVSVIVPVYNVKPYLEEALNSVIHQSYSNLQIIVVDDGSTDESGSLCDKYALQDSRIVVIHQKNGGLSVARNAGLEVASGDFISFLDSDDAYHPDFIREMLDIMIHEDADLVICKNVEHKTLGRMVETESGYQRSYPPIEEGVYNRQDVLCALVEGKINTSVWNKLYSPKLWENIRFPDGHICEDLAVTYKILNHANKVCVIDRVLYYKRDWFGNITNTWGLPYVYDWALAYSNLEKFIISNIPETQK